MVFQNTIAPFQHKCNRKPSTAPCGRRPLKNIPFFRFISITHKKSTSFDYSGGFFVIRIKFPIISGVISVYFSFISLMIRLRFTANIAIAPCISMLMRPDDNAVS